MKEAAAFSEVYRDHAAAVFRFARALGAPKEEAEDIVAETFLRVWSSVTPLRLETVRSYLIAIARNLFREGRRRRRPVDELSAEMPAMQNSEDPLRMAELHKALRALPEDEREALVMQAWLGMSYREIAGVLKTSEGALRVRVHRARLRLAEMLEVVR